jgi:hypothetical protein
LRKSMCSPTRANEAGEFTVKLAYRTFLRLF